MLVVIVRISVLDQTKRCCPLDHGTVNRCNYCNAPITNLQWSSTVEAAFASCFVENIFSKRSTFSSAREWRHIYFLNTYVYGRFVHWRWSESLWQKDCV